MRAGISVALRGTAIGLFQRVFALHGQLSVVTGAASGLGRTFALALAEAGADLALIDMNADGLQETAEQIRRIGRTVACYVADITDEGSIGAAFADAARLTGRIDILVNNAGVGESCRALLHEYTSSDWQRLLRINVDGVFMCSREALKLMHAQKRGRIINIASIWGLTAGGIINITGYAASKGAIVNLTREMAVQYAPYNIQINAVCPGFHRTPLANFSDTSFTG